MSGVFKIADDLAKLARAFDIQFPRRVREGGSSDFDNDPHTVCFLIPIISYTITQESGFVKRGQGVGIYFLTYISLNPKI